MEIVERRTETGVILELSGHLRGPACRVIDRAVGRLLAGGVRRIALELRGVVSIDAAGVGAVVRQFVRVVTRGGTLSLQHPAARVGIMLAVSGVAAVLDAPADAERAREPGPSAYPYRPSM